MQNTVPSNFHKYFSFEVGGAGVFQLFWKIAPRYTRQKILHIVEATYKMPANLNSEYEGAVPGASSVQSYSTLKTCSKSSSSNDLAIFNAQSCLGAFLRLIGSLFS